jgi:hypothetical protein
VVFYFFIEYYAKKRLKGDHSIDEKLKKLDEVLPFIDDIMKKGFELENEHTPQYIGSEDDEKLAKEIKLTDSTPAPNLVPNQSKAGNLDDLFDSLYEKL